MILYLHGFRSSPHSLKARLIGERMYALGRADDYRCPQLPASPAAAIALARQQLDRIDSSTVTLVGSSLGGYYATWLAEQLGCRAVLLNPAIHPARDLHQHVGVSTHYHTEAPFEFKVDYVAELQELAIERITQPSRYLLLAATGDEVLDWHEMVAHYPGAQQHVIAGGDHGISDFAAYLDEVMAFCNHAPESR